MALSAAARTALAAGCAPALARIPLARLAHTARASSTAAASPTPLLDAFERIVEARYSCGRFDPSRPVPEELLARICALTLVRGSPRLGSYVWWWWWQRERRGYANVF